MNISIEGMHCQACVKRVRMALEKVEGVAVRDVTIGSAVVDGDVQQQAAALEAIQKAGYQPHIPA
jgi:copper chaperone CopZ